MEEVVEGKLPSKIILEIKVPRDNEITPEATSQMIANLAGALRHSFADRLLRRKKPSITLEIVTFNQAIHDGLRGTDSKCVTPRLGGCILLSS